MSVTAFCVPTAERWVSERAHWFEFGQSGFNSWTDLNTWCKLHTPHNGFQGSDFIWYTLKRAQYIRTYNGCREKQPDRTVPNPRYNYFPGWFKQNAFIFMLDVE